MAPNGAPSKCRDSAKHVSVRLDHCPCCETFVERADAAPFKKKTGERLAEVRRPKPRRPFRHKNRAEKVVDAAPWPEQGLPRFSASGRWPLNDAIRVEQDCPDAQWCLVDSVRLTLSISGGA
jgi:hypothetical protein